jgi:hypothetical protein
LYDERDVLAVARKHVLERREKLRAGDDQKENLAPTPERDVRAKAGPETGTKVSKFDLSQPHATSRNTCKSADS